PRQQLLVRLAGPIRAVAGRQRSPDDALYGAHRLTRRIAGARVADDLEGRVTVVALQYGGPDAPFRVDDARERNHVVRVARRGGPGRGRRRGIERRIDRWRVEMLQG